MNLPGALKDAAKEWADQGCLATADLMREAAARIDDLEREVAADDEILAGGIIRRSGTRLSDQDAYYLRSILARLRACAADIQDGPSLGGEVLADNIDWLDCFIEQYSSEAAQ